MKLLLIIFFSTAFLSLPCRILLAQDAALEKISPELSDLLKSSDRNGFSRRHGIELKDGLIKVAIEVDDSFSIDEVSSKYELKHPRRRNNIVTAFASAKAIKALCEENAVKYIRLPFKLNELKTGS